MQIITFPEWNLKFTVSKVAFSIFDIDVHWYAIFIVAAIIIALIAFKKQDGKYGIRFSDILDLSIYLLPISFLGARIFYVLFSWNYFSRNIQDIWNIQDGGLAIYGGIIAGGITTYLYCKKRKIRIMDMLDYIVPYLVLGQAIGRWGNFVNVEAYGQITTLLWRMGIWENGIYKEVHPTFLYESIADFLIFLFLMRKSKNRKFSGEITYFYILFYAFVRIFVEKIRTDSLMLGNFKISEMLSIVFFVLSCFILSKKETKWKKMRKKGEKIEKVTYEKT